MQTLITQEIEEVSGGLAYMGDDYLRDYISRAPWQEIIPLFNGGSSGGGVDFGFHFPVMMR
jgi:hypothetical protein